MKTACFIFIGMNMVAVSPLRADGPDTSGDVYTRQAAHLAQREKKLERREADRLADDEHTRQAQEEYLKGTAELSNGQEHQRQYVEQLRSVESQVAAGQKLNLLSYQSYKDMVHHYGSADPRSAAARENWMQSRQTQDSLIQSRQSLKEDIREGGRVLNNQKVVLSVQKRYMDSDARYRAIDDRSFEKDEKKISDLRGAMTTQNVELPEPLTTLKQ